MRLATVHATGWGSIGERLAERSGPTRSQPIFVCGPDGVYRSSRTRTDPQWHWREENAAPGPARRVELDGQEAGDGV